MQGSLEKFLHMNRGSFFISDSKVNTSLNTFFFSVAFIYRKVFFMSRCLKKKDSSLGGYFWVTFTRLIHLFHPVQVCRGMAFLEHARVVHGDLATRCLSRHIVDS